jgi:thiol-disulfide isomerase/thioredoxin
MNLREAEACYNRMPPALQQSSFGKEIKKELDGLRSGSPGSEAYVFSKTDINGQPLSLHDYKGRYVLIDFWASWCVPCRKGNPHLKELYAKYKSKGLEIIGISDDDSRPEEWKKAVAQDGIGVWKHVLRGLDMEKRQRKESNPEDISDHYGIHSLPTKILIDPNGMIIGRYGGGGEDDEAMDKKLLEVLGK